MNLFIHGRLGHFFMNEAGADGGDGGSAAAATGGDAQASAEPSSMLGGGEQQASTEQQQEGQQQQQEKPAGAPEAYEAFTLPDGETLDEAVLPQVQSLFKDLGLPQEKAQEVLNKLLEIDKARQPAELTAEQVAEQQKQQHEAMNAQIVNLNKDWGNLCKQLPEIGGQNFEASLKTTQNVMAKFASPELRELLNYSALGSHPEFFKFIHAIGSSISEDTMVHGGERSTGPKPPEAVLWPTMQQQ
jgi:hypothetical protein